MFLFNINNAQAQCTWQPILTDGFEYTNIIPDLIPGTTYQNVPQTFSVHSGAKSMYMNFVNCVSGTGTCAGALVYVRTLSVCENMPVRISLWLTTTFTGGQSNMKMVIRDGNGLVLDSTANVLAPYSPTWTQYISNAVTSTTPTITFSMYTNVDGGPGNDLSCDDFKFEKCISVSSSRAYSVCANIDSVNLYSSLTNNPVNNGTWTGPSMLTNGYWGTFTNGLNAQGTYIYSSTPYGTAVGCPSRVDTVVAINSAIEIDITALAEAGDKVTIGDAKLPENVEFVEHDSGHHDDEEEEKPSVTDLVVANVYEPAALEAKNEAAAGDAEAESEVAVEGEAEAAPAEEAKTEE